jgi:hypothetical protein
MRPSHQPPHLPDRPRDFRRSPRGARGRVDRRLLFSTFYYFYSLTFYSLTRYSLLASGRRPLDALRYLGMGTGGGSASSTQMPCRYCGGVLPAGQPVVFCPHCGQNLTVIQCPACCAELEMGWKFWPTCGRKADESVGVAG